MKGILSRSLRQTRRTFSTVNGFPLQANVNKHAPEPVGFNLVMNRVANIAINISEKQYTKTLQIYPQDSLISYLKEQHNFDFTAFENESTKFDEISEKPAFKEIHSAKDFSTLQELPYSADKFQLVIQCLPLVLSSPFDGSAPLEAQPGAEMEIISAPSIPLEELFRVLTSRGFLLLGMPEALWEALDINRTLTAWNDTHRGEFLTFHKVPIAVENLAFLPPHKEGDFLQGGTPVTTTENTKGETVPAVKYAIGLFRKL